MPIVFKKDGKTLSFEEYVRKKDFVGRREITDKNIDGMVNASNDKKEALKRHREEYNALKKECTESRFKKKTHGTKISPDEILIEENYFAVDWITGNTYGIIVIDGDCAKLKFSRLQKILLEEFRDEPCEFIKAHARTYGKYFYRTDKLYEGFHDGFYNLIREDKGFFKIDGTYLPEKLHDARIRLGLL